MTSAIIDGIIILLLTGSIAFGYFVSRKVKVLNSSLKDLEPLVEAFSSAVDKSHFSVVQMRENIAAAERQPKAEVNSDIEDEDPLEHKHPLQVTSEKAGLGVRVVRDKKDLVRAFFDNVDTAQA